MDLIEVEGLRIAYERAGDGPPLVLLHGYVGDGSTTWRRQIEGLSDEFTVVAWDAPGAGRSADPPESFGMAGYADCLAGFIKKLDLEEPHVAGLSFGGALALEFYGRHSAIPKTLILASAYAGWAGSLQADVADQRLQQAHALANLAPEEFVDALLRRCSPKARRGSVSTRSARPRRRSTRRDCGPWHVRAPKICATYFPHIEVPKHRRYTATRTSGRP